ncbi:MAG: hypothetical protein NTZ12_09020 [Candidatus Aminicenantes bacterium]|nr:hypothetical protein [Candidatus Aminicenantes bacterium]
MLSLSSMLKGRPGSVKVLALPAMALALSACFSFPVEIPLEPECVIDTLAIVKTIPEKAALENKIVAEAVAASDANLYALIKVLQVSKPLKLQWHWYAPDNKLARESKSIEINAKGKYLSYFVAWDALPQSYYAEKKGRWTVLITADGSFLAKSEFDVN